MEESEKTARIEGGSGRETASRRAVTDLIRVFLIDSVLKSIDGSLREILGVYDDEIGEFTLSSSKHQSAPAHANISKISQNHIGKDSNRRE